VKVGSVANVGLQSFGVDVEVSEGVERGDIM